MEIPKLDPEKLKSLILRHRDGDENAANEILIAYKHIVDLVVVKLRGLNFDESAKRYGAIMGIYSAIKNYNMKSHFGCYAYRSALLMAMREISSREHLIHIPNYLLNKYLRANDYPYELMRLDNQPNRGGDTEDYMQFWDWVHWMIAPPEAPETDLGAFDEMNVESLDRMDIFEDTINKLTDAEKDAILHISGESDLSLAAHGKKFDITNEGFRQTGKRALEKLRQVVKKKELEFADFY